MTRRSSLTNRTVIVVVLSALVAGFGAHNLVGGRTSAAPVPSSVAAGAFGAGPWAVEGGIPSGFAQSEAGAVAAAASYTTTGQALIDLAPTQLPDVVRRYAAAETARAQTDTLADNTASLRAALSGGTGRIRYVKAVLATRLDEYTDDRATVRVWAVGVLWRQGAADPQADWTTSTFELVWEDNTWKVVAESIGSGPAPSPNGGTPPVDAADMDRFLEGFETWGVRR